MAAFLLVLLFPFTLRQALRRMRKAPRRASHPALGLIALAALAATAAAALSAGFVAAVAPSLRAQQPPQKPSQQQPRPRGEIKVTVDLVNILASVLDASGRPIPDLTEDNFSLLEEGVPQKIERFEAQTNRPLDLALMVDASASTFKDLKFEDEAAAYFIRQVVRPGDALAVFEFAETVTELSEFSDSIPTLESAARRISPGAGTSIYDALVLASRALRRRPEGRRRAIVLVTDAGETTSISKFEDARHAAILSEALLYTICIRPIKSESGRNTAGEHALITITESTGGALFILDELGQINAMYDRISRELRTQYLLGYYPVPLPPPGSYRRVEVKVKSGDTVHYRKGYFTANAQ